MIEKLYNTDIELGLRCLFILKEAYPRNYSLERLLYLDYLSLYIEDFTHDAVNLHPKYPFQLIEIFERKQLIKTSLSVLALKGLVDVENDKGLSFRANGNTSWLLADIQNNYSRHLKENIRFVIDGTEHKSDDELKKMIFVQKEDDNTEFSGFYPYNEEI